MIKQLAIQNFQSHKDTLLEFVPGVNIIVGETDSGKSAILRALRWVKDNRPTGNRFQSDWGGATDVTILTQDGMEIHRSKDGKFNGYKLGELVFSAVKTDVPEEVGKALNIQPVNFKRQGDDHFLIRESPGEVARYFNSVAHLSQIDTSLGNLDSSIRSLKQDLKSNKQEIERLQGNLEQYKYLGKFESQIEVLERLEEQRHQTRNGIDTLLEKQRTLQGIQREKKTHLKILEKSKLVEQLLHKSEEIKQVQNNRQRLQRTLDTLQRVKSERTRLQNLISQGKQVDKLIQINAEIKQTRRERKELQQHVEKLRELRDEKSHWHKALKRANSQLQKYAGHICPLCDGKGKL